MNHFWDTALSAAAIAAGLFLVFLFWSLVVNLKILLFYLLPVWLWERLEPRLRRLYLAIRRPIRRWNNFVNDCERRRRGLPPIIRGITVKGDPRN